MKTHFFQEFPLVIQESVQELLSVLNKHGCHLVAVGLFVLTGVDLPIIKTQDPGRLGDLMRRTAWPSSE